MTLALLVWRFHMKSLPSKVKINPLALGVKKGKSKRPEPPTPEEFARMATEVWVRNQDTLVAHFILKNPDMSPDRIMLTMHTDGTGTHFSVREKTDGEVADAVAGEVIE